MTVKARGARIVDSGTGYLACGDVGKGRLADIEVIVQATIDTLGITRDLEGKHVLITAGPTIEPIDPARYISNRSSGKTGFALAEAAADRGAEVTLVSGPVALDDPAGVNVVHVETAREMRDAVDAAFDASDISIFTAAVCDGRPKHFSDRKLKKGADDDAIFNLELESNPDILAEMGAKKRPGQVVVGFAAETENVEDNGRAKLAAKHADLIVANDVSAGKAFGADDNEVLLVTDGKTDKLPLMSKKVLADELLSYIIKLS